jgi:hypothetical protein
MKASHLARQNLISGWDSMAICMSMWPRMSMTFVSECWTRNHSWTLSTRSKTSSWREPVLLIFILGSLSLGMTMGRWRSLRNAMLTRW